MNQAQNLPILLTFLNSLLSIFLIAFLAWIYREQTKLTKKHLKDEKKSEAAEQDLLEKSLDKISKVNTSSLEEIVENSAESSKDLYNRLARQAAQQTREGVDEIIKEVKTRFDDSFKTAMKEVEQYKQAKINSIDEEALNFVSKIAKEVLPQSISLKDHYDLTLEALEKAKKSGFKI